jgi:hypothetical protein
MATCEIRCEHCGTWFKSPIQFGNNEAFFTSTLVGNAVTCRACRRESGCNKENMRFRADDEGFVGSKT